MPRVSVVIPTYNRREMLRDALDSVFAQTWRDFELIVVDDGSTDGTQEALAARYGDRVTYVRQENAGSGAARNRGIAGARGEYVAHLDSDCHWAPEKLEKQVKYLDAHPDDAMVYTLHLPCDAKGAVLRAEPNRKAYPSGRIFAELYSDTNFLMHPSVMMRKKVFDEIGGYDVALRQCQDLDMFLRVAHGHGIGAIQEPLTFYRHHPGQISRQSQERKMDFMRQVHEKAYRMFRDSEPRVTEEMYRKRMADLDFKLARLWIRQGKVREARPLLRRAWKEFPFSFRVMRYVLWAHLRG